MASAGRQRWADAQDSEAAFWNGARRDAWVVAATVLHQVEVARWVLGCPAAGQDVLQGFSRCAEFGAGPLGIGLLAFLPLAATAELIAVDPLSPMDVDGVPPGLIALVRECRQDPRLRRLVAVAEQSGLADESCDLVACVNMLDHTAAPAAVLREVWRVLRPGGLLLLACDVVSVVSRLRQTLWASRASALVRAHPFRFSATELLGLVRVSGFVIEGATPAPLHWALAGRVRNRYVLARKPQPGGRAA